MAKLDWLGNGHIYRKLLSDLNKPSLCYNIFQNKMQQAGGTGGSGGKWHLRWCRPPSSSRYHCFRLYLIRSGIFLKRPRRSCIWPSTLRKVAFIPFLLSRQAGGCQQESSGTKGWLLSAQPLAALFR